MNSAQQPEAHRTVTRYDWWARRQKSISPAPVAFRLRLYQGSTEDLVDAPAEFDPIRALVNNVLQHIIHSHDTAHCYNDIVSKIIQEDPLASAHFSDLVGGARFRPSLSEDIIPWFQSLNPDIIIVNDPDNNLCAPIRGTVEKHAGGPLNKMSISKDLADAIVQFQVHEIYGPATQLMLAATLLHELTHLLTGSFCGDVTPRISSFAEDGHGNGEAEQELVIQLCGGVVGLQWRTEHLQDITKLSLTEMFDTPEAFEATVFRINECYYHLSTVDMERTLASICTDTFYKPITLSDPGTVRDQSTPDTVIRMMAAQMNSRLSPSKSTAMPTPSAYHATSVPGVWESNDRTKLITHGLYNDRRF
ncbi:hypothetical protein BDW22DRAFT_670071 [Trametopsis cervina]|nr:hypothetical protein BDW22DRAFT_670071 [Trametopsis cervina]